MTALTIAARASQTARLKVHLARSYEARPLKVLCATDLWASSDFAVQRALTLAEAADASLLLLHVVDEDAPLRILGRRAERAHSALRWRVRQHRPRDGLPAISVRIGKPRHMIARVARDWHADLIVLGPYRARTADWLLGTTAERLALITGRPILVVNRQRADEYGDVALAAGTLDSAKRPARTLSELMMDPSPKPLCRTMLYSRRGSGAQADVAEVQLRAHRRKAGMSRDRRPGWRGI
jgi:nucleotide-binding universal stress UspA family protein